MSLRPSRKIQFVIFLIALFWADYTYGQNDLFISEFVEGTSRNQCIEIFNPTDEDILLTGNYSLEFYFNGSTSPKFNHLEGVIPSMGTHQICTTDLGVYADEYLGVGPNGNDAFALVKNGATLDIFGTIGCDPGDGWSGSGVTTQNTTLRRKPCISEGNTSFVGCSFSGLSEWQAFPVNTFSGLGNHAFGAAEVEIIGNNALCQNPEITLTATSGFASYRWSTGERTASIAIDAPATYSVTATSTLGCEAKDSKKINGTSPEIFATIASIKDVSCRPKQDGGFTVSASGGSPPFSYAWNTGSGNSPTIGGLGAGTYSVTVIDNNGCTVSKPVEVDGPITVPLTPLVTDETCEGNQDGTIELLANGSGLEYSIDGINFQSDNNFTGLKPSIYPVLVKNANGCGDEQRVTIERGSRFNLRNSLIKQEDCQGGSGGQIILVPEGGIGPYSVSFDGGPFITNDVTFSNLKADTFEIIIRDISGCSKTFLQEIKPGSEMIVRDHIVSPATCEGIDDGSLVFEVEGGVQISYNLVIDDRGNTFPYFNPAIKGLPSGKHTIIIRDAVKDIYECQIPIEFEIPVKDTLKTKIIKDTPCDAGQKGSLTVEPENGVAPFEYQLDDNTFDPNNIFTDLDPNLYVVTTKDNRGCIKVDSVDFTAGGASFEIINATPIAETCAGNNDGQIHVSTNKSGIISYSLDGLTFTDIDTFPDLSPGDYTVYAQSGSCEDSQLVTVPAAAAFSINILDLEAPLCNGGNDGLIRIQGLGGVAPYEYKIGNGVYQLNNSFTNLTQGNHTLTIRDANQCERSTTITLNAPISLQPECHVLGEVSTKGGMDGIVQIIVFGGEAPFNIQLMGVPISNKVSVSGTEIFDNLPAGNFSAEVTDKNGCKSICTFSISEPNCNFAIDEVHSDAACFGSQDGRIDLILSEGTAPYTFTWSDPQYNGQQYIADLSAGTYEVTVVDAEGCRDSTAIPISQPDALTVSILADNTVICEKDSVHLTLSDSFNRYLWSNNAQTASITAFESGLYQVAVEEITGCTARASIVIDVIKQDTFDQMINTCDPTSQGTFIAEERGVDGCMDIIISTFNLVSSDTVRRTLTTCDPTLAGIETDQFLNAFGCDSLIITNTLLLPKDTFYRIEESCDIAEVGTHYLLQPNQSGCNDLTIITTTLSTVFEEEFKTSTTCDPSMAGIDTVFLKTRFSCDSFVITNTTLLPTDTIYITESSCDASLVGNWQVLEQNQYGCDSLIVITTTLSTTFEEEFKTARTCDPSMVGIDTVFLKTRFSCDSFVITNTTLLPTDTIYITESSCDASLVGNQQVLEQNQYGCDSLILITTTLSTTFEEEFKTATTCNPSKAGIDTALLTNRLGCDSFVITNTTLLPTDTVYITEASCDASLVGNQQVSEQNQYGCDSLILITTTLFTTFEEEFKTARTCDPSMAGIDTTLLTNRLGCDSFVITNTTLLPTDTVYITESSCDASLVGNRQVLEQNQYGCDSLIVIMTTLSTTFEEEFKTATTCDPSMAGVDTALLINRLGCDSFVITRTISIASAPTILMESTCNPSEASVDTFNLTSQSLCDSVIILTTTLAETNFTQMVEQSCNPQDTGLVRLELINHFGCDSIVEIRTTLASVTDCSVAFSVVADTVCWNDIVGGIRLEVIEGNPPINYFILNDNFKDTLIRGSIRDNNGQIIINNLPLGPYSVLLINEQNFQAEEKVVISQSAPFEIQSTISDYNGFEVSCAGGKDGSIELNVAGGTAPYDFLWESGESAARLQNLAEGRYRVTITDQNYCTDTTSFVLMDGGALDISYESFNTNCVDENIGGLRIEDVSNTNGTVEYSLDGTFFQPIDAFPYTINDLESGDYQLYLQDENDCQLNTLFTVPEPNELVLTLGEEIEIELGDTLNIVPKANFIIDRYEWSADQDLPCTDCISMQTIPTKNGIYNLTAYTEQGCAISTALNVRLRKADRVFMPNVFSPNGDGRNDRYQVFFGKSVRQLDKLQIFDYEGRLMYQVTNHAINDATKGWDGFFNGQKMLPAVFVVFVKVTLLDGTNREYVQTMTLVE